MKAGWEVKPLAKLSKLFADGDWIESKDQSTDGVRLVQTGNVGESFFKDRGEKARYISKETFERLRCTAIFEGDCLISRLPDPVGRSCLLPDTGEPMITAVDCTIVRFDNSHFLPEFFVYYTQSRDYLNKVDKETSGTTRKRISRSKLGEIQIPVPPITEQHRIVAILDQAFEGIAKARANAEQNLQNARALFEGHLQSVFTNRGDSWENVTLSKICDRVSVGHVGITSKFYCEKDEGVPFLRSQNIRRGQIDLNGLQYITKEFHKKLGKSRLRTGDLLFVRVGANRGDCCSLPSGFEEINCANIVFARPSKGNATYLELYCNSLHGRSQLLGMTTGSAQGVINTKSVAELIVPLPPVSEQKKIVDLLNETHAKTQRLEALYQRKIACLDELKKSLLQQAFAGEL
jgi:type I restriction enzyme, S subunit